MDSYGTPPQQPQPPPAATSRPSASERKTSNIMSLLNDDPPSAAAAAAPTPPPQPKRLNDMAQLKPSPTPPPQSMSRGPAPPPAPTPLRPEREPPQAYPYGRNAPSASAMPPLKPTYTASPQAQHMSAPRSAIASPHDAAAAVERMRISLRLAILDMFISRPLGESRRRHKTGNRHGLPGLKDTPWASRNHHSNNLPGHQRLTGRRRNNLNKRRLHRIGLRRTCRLRKHLQQAQPFHNSLGPLVRLSSNSNSSSSSSHRLITTCRCATIEARPCMVRFLPSISMRCKGDTHPFPERQSRCHLKHSRPTRHAMRPRPRLEILGTKCRREATRL
ncbi:MYB-like DNA-binding domain-containing protein [Colletotrichum tofieldiae]|nr:MYB-like DNA-binding domain-containing protein [Colletotrichum tofieldiae]